MRMRLLVCLTTTGQGDAEGRRGWRGLALAKSTDAEMPVRCGLHAVTHHSRMRHHPSPCASRHGPVRSLYLLSPLSFSCVRFFFNQRDSLKITALESSQENSISNDSEIEEEGEEGGEIFLTAIPALNAHGKAQGNKGRKQESGDTRKRQRGKRKHSNSDAEHASSPSVSTINSKSTRGRVRTLNVRIRTQSRAYSR